MNDHYYTRHILPDLDNRKMQRMAAWIYVYSLYRL